MFGVGDLNSKYLQVRGPEGKTICTFKSGRKIMQFFFLILENYAIRSAILFRSSLSCPTTLNQTTPERQTTLWEKQPPSTRLFVLSIESSSTSDTKQSNGVGQVLLHRTGDIVFRTDHLQHPHLRKCSPEAGPSWAVEVLSGPSDQDAGGGFREARRRKEAVPYRRHSVWLRLQHVAV